MAKQHCAFTEGPDGLSCDCEVCRLTHKQLTDAPEVDPSAIAENVILDDPDDVDLDDVDELDDDMDLDDDADLDDDDLDDDDEEYAEPSVYDATYGPEPSVYDRPRIAKSLITPHTGPLPDSGPSVYDLAHQPAIPPTATTALRAKQGLLNIVRLTRAKLVACEHSEGVAALVGVLEKLEADAEKAGAIAASIIEESARRAGGMR